MSNFLKENGGVPRGAAMALSDLPSIANNTILGNNSGSSSYPSALTASQVNTILGTFSNPMTTLGDIIYGGSSGTATRLAGNTTTTKEFLVQTGTGSVSAAPSWATIASSDVPAINLASSGNGGVTGALGVTNGGTGQTSLAQYYVLIGNGTSGISTVAPSSTSGVPLISQGSSSDPTFGTAVVAGGGTGATSFTAYAPVIGGTTSTGALQSASSGISNSGYVLTSTGSSSAPTFQELPYRAGQTAISLGATSLSITFSSSLGTSSYALNCTMYNSTDTYVQYQPIVITSQSSTGFTATWNAAAITGNYYLNWYAALLQ